MKVLTVLLAFIWFLGWGFWFLYERGHIELSSIQSKTPVVEQKEDTIAIVPAQMPKLSFLVNHVPSADSIDQIIDSLMKLRQPGETIQVISYYTDEEAYSGNNENRGVQRSINLIHNARKRYAGRVLQPIGLKLKENIDTTGLNNYFKVDKVEKMAPLRVLNDQRILVFGLKSSENGSVFSKISNPLDSLTNIWQQEKKRLIITGYTDNTSDETDSYNLGFERAKSIQEYLVASGFPEDRITTLSRGDKDPISINNTYDGRYLNRRVEILVDN